MVIFILNAQDATYLSRVVDKSAWGVKTAHKICECSGCQASICASCKELYNTDFKKYGAVKKNHIGIPSMNVYRNCRVYVVGRMITARWNFI